MFFFQHLREVIHLTLHVCKLRALQFKQLQEIVGQRVDLVGHRSQTLGGVALGVLEGSPLIFRLIIVLFAVLGHSLQILMAVVKTGPALRQLRGQQSGQFGQMLRVAAHLGAPSICNHHPGCCRICCKLSW
jgi:hypothetical protein